MVKNLMIFKELTKNNDKSPDFKLVTTLDNKLVKCGAGWNKKTKDGQPYISVILANPFKDFKGFHLEEDKKYPEEPEESKQFLTPEEQNRVKEEEFISM